ncbi:PRP6 (YBR055C) [Zygosaccharomyces parabailii]|nr:PRP6 (YBR055C) [Zygosaccharomyces parabailii]
MDLPSFLSQKPPPGYVPGVGRGATGFSTRGDKGGPLKVPKRFETHTSHDSLHEDKTRTAEHLEEEEANQIYSELDLKLSTRNRSKRHEERPGSSISEQFADLKRSLATVTEDQWLSIPSAGDYTRKRKRERLDEQLNRKTYAAPDTLLTPHVNLSKLTEERERILEKQLDASIFEGDNGAAIAEAQEYLNQLQAKSDLDDNEDDVKKMRLILQSYRHSAPKKPEGWIASARLEEKARRLRTAKSLIEEGCSQCPRSEDIWLESIRLHGPDNYSCKVLVAEGIRFNPQSLSLWLKAIDLENEVINKQRVVRRALQELPHCEELWKKAVKYSKEKEEVLKILQKAVELIPRSFDLCAALVQLQDYEDAKKILKAATKSMPLELRVWILAAQIEESKGDNVSFEQLTELLTNGIKEMQKNNVKLSLRALLEEANSLLSDHHSHNTVEAFTCVALNEYAKQQSEAENTRTIAALPNSIIKILAFRFLLKLNPTKISTWASLKATCESTGKIAELYSTFDSLLFNAKQDYRILKEHPVLALMYSKELWKYGEDLPKSLNVLDRALEIVPFSLDIWLAKIKLLCVSARYDVAEITFKQALKNFENYKVSNVEKLYYKYVSFLRFQQHHEVAIEFLKQKCLSEFPKCYKFHLQLGQIYHSLGQLDNSRESYTEGTKYLPGCVLLWISLAQLEEEGLHRAIKARSVLDMAFMKNPENEYLFLAQAQLEARLGNTDQARFIVHQALQKHPHSPHLWAENIRLLPLKKANVKKTMFQDALKSTNNSYEILIEIGISFFEESQYGPALKWFERATKKNPAYGDSWVWLARCRKKLNNDIAAIKERVKELEPTHGVLWVKVSKNPKFQYLSPSQILDTLIFSEQVV